MAQLVVRTYGDGRWDATKRIWAGEPFERFSLHRVEKGIVLATIFNKRDHYGKLRLFEITPATLAAAPKGQPLRETRSITIDFTKKENRVEGSTNSYHLTSVLVDPSQPESMWIFGEYSELHKEFLIFFWGGGHMPSPGKICSWTYSDGQLGKCQSLWEKRRMFREIFSLGPWDGPRCVLGSGGVPYVGFTAREYNVFSTDNEEPYLAWREAGEWRKQKVAVPGSTRADRGSPEGVDAVAAIQKGLAWLWCSFERDQYTLHLSLYEDGKWKDPLEIGRHEWIDIQALATDDSGIYVSWSTLDRSGEAIHLSVVRNGEVTPIRTFPVYEHVRKILLAPISEGRSVHLIWTSQKNYDDESCQIYHTQIDLEREMRE